MSTALPCFNMPGFRAAAAKNQFDSKRGFFPNSFFPNMELTGGEGIGSSKLSYAVPEKFDAPETVNCSEYLVGTMAHRYSGKQKFD